MKPVILAVFLFCGFAMADTQQACERLSPTTSVQVGPHTMVTFDPPGSQEFWWCAYIDSTDVVIHGPQEANPLYVVMDESDSTPSLSTVLSVIAVETSRGYQCFLDEIAAEGL